MTRRLALILLLLLAPGCGSSSRQSASDLAPIHGKEHGRFVKASDSRLSGVNGAMPGIIMPAHPKAGDRYRQEYYPPGEALDEARVLGERGPVSVPYGTFKRALVTSEFSPLEPQTEEKYYVAGVGEILERVVKGHREEFRLVRLTR
jgi:hypothetical protein